MKRIHGLDAARWWLAVCLAAEGFRSTLPGGGLTVFFRVRQMFKLTLWLFNVAVEN